MVKKETIHRLMAAKVTPVFETTLSPHGYKFNKGKSAFSKKNKQFEQQISMTGHAASIEYDEREDRIYLFFNVHFSVRSSAYDKWHVEHLEQRNIFYSHVSQVKLYTILDFNDFSEADFFTPSKAVAFKNYVTGALKDHTNLQTRAEFSDMKDFLLHIEGELEKLDKRASVEAIVESTDPALARQHANLLIWDRQLDRARGYYDQMYELYLNAVKEEESAHYLDGFEKFLKAAERLLQLKYHNPFVPKLIRTGDETKELELLPGHKYRSFVRYEGDASKVRTGVYNEATGDCFLLLENRTIFKVDKGGNTVFEKQIEIGSMSDHLLFTRGLELVRNSNCLSLGRFILTNENALIDVQAHIRSAIKAKEKVNFTISDAVLISEEKGYMVLCSFNNVNSILCLFDKDFNYVEEHYLGGTPIRIFENKEWIIVNNGKHAFFNIKGDKLFEFEYGNANVNMVLSNKGECAISFGYATKSDVYNLTTMKGQVLWAHPTYLKNYKEVLYNDTHHNFNLSIAKFSPDDKYLVGGGYHGKYVAWTLPKFDRIEMLPATEFLPLLKEAEIVPLDGKVFLKNRGHDIRNIQFFNASGNFITQLGPYNFLWNKEFENTGCLPVQGNLRVLSDRYLTHMNENIFTIFKRV